MSSKINGLNGASPAVDAGGARRTPETATGQTSGSSAPTSSSSSDVQFTDAANLLAGLVQHLHTLPAVDAARVAHFRTAIDNGSYTVQPGVVAGHLMQVEQSLAQLSGS